ncbi:MAG: carboxypeptidase regulatory-like domain-containing protein [Candidatus Aminicenantes bacterium]|nr:carboxypeptidase regulatory-like domain-containing protein [Candidatus Aminicenantes bacterium]
MKKKLLLVFWLIFMVMFFVSERVEAKSAIYDILAKGSTWTLNVDGESGTLELLGGRGSRTTDGGWEMTSEIRWQGNPGTLQGRADGSNSEQRVILNVQRRNGLRVTCEGYIAQETDRFMAGISKHPARPRDIRGAWYAIKQGKNPRVPVIERKPRKPRKPRLPIRDTAVRPAVKPAEIARPAVATAPAAVTAEAGGSCSISGKVYGSGVKAAKVFFVALYGPDNLTKYRETKKFDSSGAYRFTGLPYGRYRLAVDTKADIAIGPRPSSRVVRCTGSGVTNVNFELK